MLILLAGWVGVWVVVELLVISTQATPGAPLWLALHGSYLWGTSYWEIAILRRALDARDGRTRLLRDILVSEPRVVARFLTLKLMLLPAILLGLAALIAPGTLLIARCGHALYSVADRGDGPLEALRRSVRISKAVSLRLARLALLVVLANVAGAAVFALGLPFTLPVTILVGAHIYRTLEARCEPVSPSRRVAQDDSGPLIHTDSCPPSIRTTG